MKKKFKKRYILGAGYPWAMGTGPYREICLSNLQISPDKIELDWPEELWDTALPQYRLVLERVETDKK